MKTLIQISSIFASLLILSSCDFLESLIDTDQPEVAVETFKHIAHGLNGFDELIYSDKTVICYKESNNGLPSSLLILRNDEENPDFFNYVTFDSAGKPSYMNMNNQHVFIQNISDSHYDLLLVNENNTFVKYENIPIEINVFDYWSDSTQTKSGYTQSNAQNAISLLNHFMGGFSMATGTAGILVGCAMLVPGANIAVGATIALAGAATFISGALITTRATDKLVSDGSHTEGFDEAANIIGTVGTLAGDGTIKKKLTEIIVNQGYEYIQKEVDKKANFDKIREKAKKIITGRLSTGNYEIESIQDAQVLLSGRITKKLNNEDHVGIFISKDSEALHIFDCELVESINSGNFSIRFSGLEYATEYFYRAYYYSTEFQEYYVSGIKSFIMPGVKTLTYNPINDHEYDVKGKFINIGEGQSNYGICYSPTNEFPTINDSYIEANNINNGIFSTQLNLYDPIYYYRAYAIVDNQVMYGQPEILTNERLILERFYKSTNGEQWTNDKNWCTSKSLEKWYGISMDGKFVNYIDLVSNNLQGDGVIQGLKVLHDIHIENNNLRSLTIRDCPNFQIQHHWMTNDDSINLESYNVINCGKSAAYVDFYDIFDAVENGYTSYYTHENWLGNSHIGRCKIYTVRINNHYSCHQTFFNNITSKYIEIKNVTDFGRIFFNDVTCDKLIFENCKFSDQGISIGFDSNIPKVYITNCNIPDWMGCDRENTILIINNTRIGSDYISSFSGTQHDLFEYLNNKDR